MKDLVFTSFYVAYFKILFRTHEDVVSKFLDKI